MPGSHWMIVMTPENFEISRSRGLDLIGLKARHRKKAERMAVGDRLLLYVSGAQVFPATGTVSSGFFEDHEPIWLNTERKPDVSPWRVRMRTDVLLQQHEYVDATQVAPRLLYVKRWAPEDWPLAFQGQVHLLSSADFGLIEGEMRRTIDRRARRSERPPRRPREGLRSPVSPHAGAPAALMARRRVLPTRTESLAAQVSDAILSTDDAPDGPPALPDRVPPVGQPSPVDPSPPFVAT